MNIETENHSLKKESRWSLWIKRYAESSHADKWLAGFSFIEASFFVLPPSTLMIAIMATGEKYKKWIYYASLTTVFSVFGGLFGYLIGSVFYDTLGRAIVEAYDLADDIERVRIMFQDNAFLAIFIAAFTPIPYKVFTLASGFFNVNLITFVVASFLGRGMRYFLISFFVNLLGKKASKRAMDYLSHFALTVAVIVIIYFLYKILNLFFSSL
jgi:membrane protein YqaA with SNARE-associated domain